MNLGKNGYLYRDGWQRVGKPYLSLQSQSSPSDSVELIFVGLLLSQRGSGHCRDRSERERKRINISMVLSLVSQSKFQRPPQKDDDGEGSVASTMLKWEEIEIEPPSPPSSPRSTDNLHLLFVVAFALAFFISSSIFFWRCSSFFSNIKSCCRKPTMASLADSLVSFRPVKYDIHPDIVGGWVVKQQGRCQPCMIWGKLLSLWSSTFSSMRMDVLGLLSDDFLLGGQLVMSGWNMDHVRHSQSRFSVRAPALALSLTTRWLTSLFSLYISPHLGQQQQTTKHPRNGPKASD